MDISHRSAGSGATERTADLHPESAAYLTHLAREQDRFLASVAEAGAHVGDGPGQLGKVVAIQNRLTQEFLDAQRSIIRRRAETEAAVVQIEYTAARDAHRLAASERSRGSAWPAPPLSRTSALPAPSGWSAPGPRGSAPSLELARVQQIDDMEMASIARLVDGAFAQREPDGDIMRRQLREVLDGWWTAEQHEAKAAVDDATARAAMRVHLARVEADITRADQVRAEFAAPTYRYEPPRHVSPLITALDTTSHEDLDDVLASLLDDLDGAAMTEAPVEQPSAAQPLVEQPAVALTGSDVPTRSSMPRVANLIPDPIPTPVLPPPAGAARLHRDVDSLTDETAAPQEAFDRFWEPKSARTAGGRDWVFPQLLLPAVAVIAVLALVLAVVG